ncbi:hypothetical protein ABB37_05985 [Leptomonas pyrrhocoris]|uniref:Dynein heavy chain coiled coil stalk domain-containing protein n=1 Tax=Leptomonas pyrrhocoris TaxID=157538 RepID=A0A0N1J4P0_LEPPY|nr:hypothetical protein ABB37_05985 [Leptomonas pyrrhocoris]KPA78921.1 hypothetical protein ABB37_05985 [Leptomonas pyrrhocoris]|eukprot:XP_015657360.1 hypothetical protein ABB37_05985 [Leptomonas pyrrhocoris]
MSARKAPSSAPPPAPPKQSARKAPSSAPPPAPPKQSAPKRSESSPVVPNADDTNYDVLSKVSSMAHVRVVVNDLVAYEYVDEKTNGWCWGLGTVASIPAPRLVQLMLWAGSGGALPPGASPVSEAERAAAVRRLAELQAKRQTAEEEMEDLNKTITMEQAHYDKGRAAYKADAERAISDANEAQKVVKQLKESDWREIRSYVKPPDIVKLIMDATLITLGERPSDWTYILKVIRQRDFMKRLADFDSLSISPSTRRLLRKEYLSNRRFTHEDAMEGSHALGALQGWVSAQLATNEVTADMADFEKTRARDRKKIAKMEEQLRERRKEVEAYKDEESKLRATLGDLPMHLDYDKQNGAAASPGAKRDGPDVKGRAGATPLHEDVHGGANDWTFTDVSKVVLLSSILVNYDKPEATLVTLTPTQLQQLKEALAARATPLAEMQKADNKIKNLEDDLQDTRGDLAEALRALADAKAKQAAHNAQLAAKDRDIDDAKEEAAAAKAAALAPSEELAKELADKDKEVEDLKAALADEKAKKNSVKSTPAEIGLEKEPVAQDGVQDGSVPHLFHAADDRELANMIARLEEEIRILRSESAAANDVLEGVNGTINSRPDLKKFLEEDS